MSAGGREGPRRPRSSVMLVFPCGSQEQRQTSQDSGAGVGVCSVGAWGSRAGTSGAGRTMGSGTRANLHPRSDGGRSGSICRSRERKRGRRKECEKEEKENEGTGRERESKLTGTHTKRGREPPCELGGRGQAGSPRRGRERLGRAVAKTISLASAGDTGRRAGRGGAAETHGLARQRRGVAMDPASPSPQASSTVLLPFP